MTPLYDSDSAQERYEQAAWKNVELWEKTEARLRRKRQIWVLLSGLACLTIFSIPVIDKRLPKWRTLQYVRKAAEAVHRVERYSLVDRAPYQLRFLEAQGRLTLNYVIERVPNCQEGANLTGEPRHETVKERDALSQTDRGYQLLRAEEARKWGYQGISDRFCFDPLLGNWSYQVSGGVAGLVVVPPELNTSNPGDRPATETWSAVILSGVGGEVLYE